MTCFKKAVFSFHWQSIYPEWKSASLSRWLRVCYLVFYKYDVFRLRGLSIRFIFLRLVCEAHLRKINEHELFSFSTVYALEGKKKKIMPQKIIRFSSPEMQAKMTNFLAKAREIPLQQRPSCSVCCFTFRSLQMRTGNICSWLRGVRW